MTSNDIPDNCPKCDAPTGPADTTITGNTLSSRYQCCFCGHAWTTNRMADAYDGFDPHHFEGDPQ